LQDVEKVREPVNAYIVSIFLKLFKSHYLQITSLFRFIQYTEIMHNAFLFFVLENLTTIPPSEVLNQYDPKWKAG
jgi:hypothetical protein